MGADLLLEVGCEEIPAGFLSRGLGELDRAAGERLAAARLECDRITVLGTPRRLVLLVDGLADRQPDIREQVVGPPVRAAYDQDGQPTQAALGFAKRNGVEVTDLVRVESGKGKKKGEYIACTRMEPGAPTAEVLPGLLGELIRGLSWPKSMRWGGREEPFVRPVHWIVALHGGQVVPIEFAGVASGQHSRGHRFLAPGPIELDGGRDDYLSKLRQAFVVVDPAARRDMIVAELQRIEGEVSATVRDDPALLDEVSFLVEYPVAVCGEFDPAFLEVPEEVIVSAMRSHQRYFAMEDGDGKLVNRFVTIAGTVTRDLDTVRRGNQRVLAARLADARFFFREDQKVTLERFATRLDDVVFQAKLGSVGQKCRRIAAVAEQLCPATGVDPAAARRVAALCKADLVTTMVGEFPDLQGIMGDYYARAAGEPEAVATAIAEHYRPRGAGDRMPTSALGAVIGIADRIDTVVGCFAVGLAPTGSADPYGLRRAALAILSILLDRGWSLSLTRLIEVAAGQLAEVAPGPECRAEVAQFFRTRLKGLLSEQLPADCVEAALTAGFDDLPDARARAQAVARLRERDDFAPLATAFKRVANILKGTDAAGDPDPARFREPAERALWDGFADIRARVDTRLGERDYHDALQILAELKPPVDAFFEAVMVMDEDPAVRDNRLALLGRINAAFNRIADFRQLMV